MPNTHFQISGKQLVGYIVGLLVVISGMCVWVYQRETDTVYRSIQTNQSAIQKTNDLAEKNHTDIAVIEERVAGHTNNRTHN